MPVRSVARHAQRVVRRRWGDLAVAAERAGLAGFYLAQSAAASFVLRRAALAATRTIPVGMRVTPRRRGSSLTVASRIVCRRWLRLSSVAILRQPTGWSTRGWSKYSS